MAISIGIIGTGIFATQKHLPAIAKTKGLELRGCYNRTKEKAETFAKLAKDEYGFDVKVYDTMEELINDPSIDTIDATLPVEHNLEIVRAVLKAKKPICFEKPLSATLEDGAEIVKLAESTDIPVMVLENWSFHHGTRKLKEQLPKIGETIMFHFQVSGPFRLSPYHSTKWRQAPKHIGGFLSDSGVHDLAQVTDVLGPIGSVSARATQSRPESGAADTMTALFNMSDGKAFGSYTQARFSAASEQVLRFEIFGTNGTLVYERPSGTAGGLVILREGKGADNIVETRFELPGDDLNGVTDEFANWRDVVESMDKTKVLVTPRKAFHQYASIYAAVKSAESDGNLVHVKQLA